MITFDEAAALVVATGAPLGTEVVALRQAHNRVLAQPVLAMVSSPPADVSAMDGYAVRERDLASLPASLPVAGESFAGRPFTGELPLGSCIRIFTGAAVPPSADRVIVQEVVRRHGDVAHFDQPLSSGRHVRRKGSDFRHGDELLTAGTVLRPRALVAAAGADVAELTVTQRPKVRLLSTGDELVEPGRSRDVPGSIPESVSFGVAALAEEWGGAFDRSVRLPDDLSSMEAAAAKALDEADLVIVTGGASVGEKDFAKAMFAPAGLELIFSKVAIKPGKPVWLGQVRGKLVLGLPGNPTSALVTARLFLAPLLCRLTGRDPADPLRWRSVPLADELQPTGTRETFSRGYLEDGSVRLFGHQDSSAQKVLADASLLVRRPVGDLPIGTGTPVEILDF